MVFGEDDRLSFRRVGLRKDGELGKLFGSFLAKDGKWCQCIDKSIR